MKALIVKILLGLLSWMGVYGAFTTLNSTDQLVNFPTTYNNNLTQTIAVGTTSVASITTLSNLVSIGTITTGVWNGTTIAVANGGTGSTTLSANQVLLGNGTGNISLVNGFGTSGQFLTSNGAATAPSWQTSAINLGGTYNWTGNHDFNGAQTTLRGTAVGVGTSTPSINGIFNVASSTYFAQGVGIGVATTTANANLEIGRTLIVPNATTSNLFVGAGCTGCIHGFHASTTAIDLTVTNGVSTSKTTSCNAGENVVGGGYTSSAGTANLQMYVVYQNYPSGTTGWITQVICTAVGGGSTNCPAGTLTVYALCGKF